MSNLDMAMQRIAMLEARVAALETGKLGSSPSQSTGGPRPNLEALSDDMLEKHWADKVAKKDPPKWGGKSYVGVAYSQIESAWHESNAGFLAWKAEKGRAEVPVRVNKEGKPWHEADTFEAKLCLAWARRNAGGVKAVSKPAAADYGYEEPRSSAPKAATGDFAYGEPMFANFDDGIPF